MKGEFLLSAIGDIDDDLIAEAADIRPVRRVPQWAKYTATAACICLIATAVFTFPSLTKDGAMAPECADKADNALMDQKEYSYTEDAVQDTITGVLMHGVTFFFYDEAGELHTEWWNYPDEEVSVEDVMSEYLRQSGSDAVCLSVLRETEGESDAVHTFGNEEVISHNVGVSTVTLTLDGIPEEHILRGLSETVRCFGLGYVKEVRILADSEEIYNEKW